MYSPHHPGPLPMISGILAIPAMFAAGAIVWTAFWLLAGWCCIAPGSVLGSWL